jgi:uncharacterized protein YoxC
LAFFLFSINFKFAHNYFQFQINPLIPGLNLQVYIRNLYFSIFLFILVKQKIENISYKLQNISDGINETKSRKVKVLEESLLNLNRKVSEIEEKCEEKILKLEQRTENIAEELSSLEQERENLSENLNSECENFNQKWQQEIERGKKVFFFFFFFLNNKK